ncbi:MAG: hypothetical protein ACXVAY_11525 [Mucilaginibacter sp.]
MFKTEKGLILVRPFFVLSKIPAKKGQETKPVGHIVMGPRMLAERNENLDYIACEIKKSVSTISLVAKYLQPIE